MSEIHFETGEKSFIYVTYFLRCIKDVIYCFCMKYCFPTAIWDI